MVVVQEVVHPLSLDFRNQQKVVVLRDQKGLSWESIAAKVRNRKGKPTTWKTACRSHGNFNKTQGRRKYKYWKCGRKPTTFTDEVKKHLVKRLLVLRKTCVCTSETLAKDLATTKHVTASAGAIRKVLNAAGYYWLPRRRRPKYSAKEKAKRVAWCKETLDLSDEELQKKLALSIDGVVLTVPPEDLVDRHNHCWHGETHVYRTKAEGNSTQFDRKKDYNPQVPANKCLPLWGGISFHGFAVLTWHPSRKLNSEQWEKVLRSG
jgi:hypothetical protein